MLRFFKRKRQLTPQEDLEAVLLHIHAGLLKAEKYEGVERQFRVTNTLGVAIRAIREAWPNVPIENDGPAMTILSAGGDKPNYEQIDCDIEFSIQQARGCPQDKEAIITIVMSLLAPSYVDAMFEEAKQG